MPGWLSLDKDNLKGIVTAAPTRDQMPQNVKEQQVVELYSR
jgi:ribosomal protein S4